jgi:hypothetical protein
MCNEHKPESENTFPTDQDLRDFAEAERLSREEHRRDLARRIAACDPYDYEERRYLLKVLSES